MSVRRCYCTFTSIVNGYHTALNIYIYIYLFTSDILPIHVECGVASRGGTVIGKSKITTVYNALISRTRTRVYYLSFIIFLKTCLYKCDPESYAFITICIMLTIYIYRLCVVKKIIIIIITLLLR